jgi:hypothetical protein
MCNAKLTVVRILACSRSRNQGDRNHFSGFPGNYSSPLIRPNVYSNLAGNLPNRFPAWGTLCLPGKMQIPPVVGCWNRRSHDQYDVLGGYAPKVPKSTVHRSASANNVTNQFHALAVHASVADPAVGTFFGNYQRRFQADFDVIF